MDFDTAYCSDPAIWQPEAVKKVERKLSWLPGRKCPVEDPHGLCHFMTTEEQTMLVEKADCHIEWLDLTQPADLEKFAEIWQRHTDQWYSVFGEEHYTSENRFLKLLRYVEMYYIIPDELTAQLRSR